MIPYYVLSYQDKNPAVLICLYKPATIIFMSQDLKNYTSGELRQVFASLGQREYLAEYVFTFIHQKDCGEIAEISPLPLALRERLTGEGYFISRLKTLKKLTDPDGTMKFLFQMEDGQAAEAVRLDDDGRSTLCLSTQVGCRMGCAFCATGQLTFQRNMTAGEIVDQVYRIEADSGKAQNLVYMGMGEPLDNYDEVMRSLAILNHPKGRNFGIRHITISTCGLAEEIERLADEDLRPRLAISLHAADPIKRSQIMKISKAQPLARVMEAVQAYQQKTNKRVTFEYCMIRNLNDGRRDMDLLIELVADCSANVNLIELNEFEGCLFKASPPSVIRTFAEGLQKAGIETVIRYKRGRNIKAACGQLGAERLEKKKN